MYVFDKNQYLPLFALQSRVHSLSIGAKVQGAACPLSNYAQATSQWFQWGI